MSLAGLAAEDREAVEAAPENLTLTRRMREGLIEQKNNTQIDKNNLVANRQIVVPKTKENREEYLRRIDFKRKMMEKFKETNIGFARHIEDDEEEQGDKYEMDDEDAEFVKRIFPKEVRPNLTPQQIVESPLVRDFEKAIAYLEVSNDTSFMRIKFGQKMFSPEILESIVEYWKKKCRILKRPLLRLNWKVINTNPLYGEVDINKIAFRSREKKKRTMRNSLKMTSEDNFDFLNKFKEESEIALTVVSMIIKREELKLQAFQLSFCGPQEAFHSNQRIEEGLADTRRFVGRVDEILKKFAPAKPAPAPLPVETVKRQEPVAKPEPPVHVAEVPVVNNDTSFFISSLIHEMSIYGFEFNDFKSENIKKVLNEKIRNLKQRRVTTSLALNEKCIDLKRDSQVADNFNPANILLVKRSTYNAANDVYMEKVEPEKLKNQREIFQTDDFVSDSLIKRNLTFYDDNFSHCKFSRNESFNPFVYCGKSNLNLSSSILEAIKLQRYNSLLGDYYCEDDKAFGLSENFQDMQTEASQYIEQIKIAENFRNYTKNIKRAF